MGDDVKIVSVTAAPARKVKHVRDRELDDIKVLYVERLPNQDVPEITRVDPAPDVLITGVSESTAEAAQPIEAIVSEGLEVVEQPSKKKVRVEPNCPVYWTKCERCGSLEKHYHIVEVSSDSHEWLNVCAPLLHAKFTVQKLSRIQNQGLWDRLQSERQLMRRSRAPTFDVNERLLYHTSRANTKTICAEGLDQRLGGMGNFGRGIYFSDNPLKCNCYWSSRSRNRIMFACRVLLGDIKVYPPGNSDKTLVREPPKQQHRGRNDTETYDSVLGNICYNEFVVYNAYRVMPEYVIEYQTTQTHTRMVSAATATSPNPSLPMCHICGELTTICHCS